MAFVKKIHKNAQLPRYNHPMDAGADVFTCEDLVLNPNTRGLVNIGISITPPPGSYIRIAPRSGLSCNGIDIGAGVVDPGYRGEIKVLVINNSKNTFIASTGFKIAQLIFEKVFIPCIYDAPNLPGSDRGSQGFGSSGD